MAALSDYLESGILNHIFRQDPLPKPENISIALTGDVAKENDTGSTIPELPTTTQLGTESISTNYQRIDLGSPATAGTSKWNNTGYDIDSSYAVFSNDVNHSGYFYPVYLAKTSAEAGETGIPKEYTFSEFPGITFFSPFSLAVSGAETNPGYELYTGNGFIKNKVELNFPSAATDWGWVSGVAILDSSDHGSGNLLMYAELNNPRYVYAGDTIKFDVNALEINLN